MEERNFLHFSPANENTDYSIQCREDFYELRARKQNQIEEREEKKHEFIRSQFTDECRNLAFLNALCKLQLLLRTATTRDREKERKVSFHVSSRMSARCLHIKRDSMGHKFLVSDKNFDRVYIAIPLCIGSTSSKEHSLCTVSDS